MDQRGVEGTTLKWILSIFKFRNEYYKQIGKSRWKNRVICLVSMLPSWVMVLKLSKKCIFCNFVLTSARNLSRLKQLTYMYLKGLLTQFQKLVLFIMLWLTVSEVWVFEVEEFLRNFCWVSILFDILIAKISWTVAQTPINHSIFWKSVMRTFRCIYVNCFNNLVFCWGQQKIVKDAPFWTIYRPWLR